MQDDDDDDTTSTANDEDHHLRSSEEHEKLLLRIKSSPTTDVQVYANPDDRISKVKLAILHALDKASSSSSDPKKDKEDKDYSSASTAAAAADQQQQQPYVRLIAAGRLLAPDTARLRDFTLQQGQVVHAVVSHKRGAQAAAAAPVLSRRALRGTGIDAAGWAVRRTAEDDEEDETDDDDDEEEESDNEDAVELVDLEQGLRRHRRLRRQQQQRLGFDRLRDTIGFRRSEVAAIRGYFSRSVDRWIRQNPVAAEQAAAGETDALRRRLLQEDAWMQSQGPASEFRLNLGSTAAALAVAAASDGRNDNINLWRSGGMSASVGTDRDFVWGFMLGFFVGFLMLLWVWMPTVPHKQKLGILTGISVQLAFGLWQGSGPDPNDDLVLGDY